MHSYGRQARHTRGFEVSFILTILFMAAGGDAAHAFCVNGARPCLAEWKSGGARHGQPIPIWVVTSGRFSVAPDPAKTDGSSGVGMPTSRFLAEVKAVARALSEGPADIHLELAGETDSSAFDCQGAGMDHPGIVIGNRAGPSSAPAGCSATCGVAVNITSPGPDSEFGTEPFSNASPTGFHSMRSILLHELAHVFNLNHLHQTCDENNITDEAGHEQGPSSFVSVLNFQQQYPRRDDFEGLQLQYGSSARTLSVLASRTGLPGSWVAIEKDEVLVSNSPPAISQPAAISIIAGTSGSDLLWVVADTDGSGYGERLFLADSISQQNAKTRYRPSVAMMKDRVAVAWLAEPSKSGSIHALVATGTLPDPVFSFRNLALFGEAGTFQDIGIGYDVTSDRLLVTLRDAGNARPKLLVIHPETLDREQTVELGASVLDLGKTVCESPPVGRRFFRPRRLGSDRTDCITVLAGGALGIHWLALARGSMSDGQYQFAGRQGINALAFGGTDLARIRNVLVLTTGEGAGAEVLRTTVDFPYFPTRESLETGHWPIAVGGVKHPAAPCPGLPIYDCAPSEFRIVVPRPD